MTTTHPPPQEIQEKVTAPAALTDDEGARREAIFGPKTLLLAADLLALVVAAIVTYTVENVLPPRFGEPATTQNYLVLSFVTAPVWLFIFARQRLYNTRFIARRIDELRRIVNGIFLGSLSIALLGYLMGRYVPRSALVTTFLVTLAIVSLEREVARRLFSRMRTRGRLLRHVIIVGANGEGVELAAMFQSEPWLGYRVVGFVDDWRHAPQLVPGVPLLGSLDDTLRIVEEQGAPGVVIAATAVEADTINRLARDLLEAGVHVELSSTLRDIASQRLTVRPLGRFPVVYVEPIQRGGWRAAAKRTFDVVVAGVGLVVAAPVIALAAIAIKLDSRGPILFHQKRVGRSAGTFNVLKLRTMVPNAEDLLHELLGINEADGPLFKISSDPRITRVGRFLRKASIDELPQLWNVLRGEMSLVGPRPALVHESEKWDPLLKARLRVKPGITGMWQVNGRSSNSFEDYTRLDLYYVDNWSLLTDVAILCKTVPVVLSQRGAV